MGTIYQEIYTNFNHGPNWSSKTKMTCKTSQLCKCAWIKGNHIRNTKQSVKQSFVKLPIFVQNAAVPKKGVGFCQKSIGVITYGRFFPVTKFFAAGCIFADFAIVVLFYPVIKNLWKFVCILFVFCHTQILNLRAKINFANMLKIIWKSGKFWTIFNIFSKLIFALKFDICVWQHPNDMHRNFHKFFITG